MKEIALNLETLNKIVYKFTSWWHHLGLLLIGYFFENTFNVVDLLYYLSLGIVLLGLAHAADDKKRFLVVVYVALAVLLLFELSHFQKAVCISIIFLIFLYDFVIKKTPLSAPFKGFAYPLLFWLPISRFSLDGLWLYLLLGCIATTSELFHEASHFDNDIKEGKKTTAIFFNFKQSGEVRKKVKFAVLTAGVVILLTEIVITQLASHK